MAKLKEVLAIPDFFLLWLGQVISQFGDKFMMLALVGLVYKRAPASAYELAKLFIFVAIPVFVIGPAAGAYSDRWNRKYTMIISDLVRGLCVIFIVFYWALVPGLKPIFPVYIAVFIIFSATRFFIPAKMSIIPVLVPQEKLLEANSLIHTTGMIAAALGFGLSGIIVSMPKVGVKGGLVIDAATFFISALLIVFMRVKENATGQRENLYQISRRFSEIIIKSVMLEIRDGIIYIFSRRQIHFVILFLFILAGGIGACHVVLIVFIEKALLNPLKALGLLIMYFGAGLFAGSLCYGKFGHRLSKQKAIFASLMLGGVFLAQFVIFVGAYKNFSLAAAIVFLLGMSVSPIIISANTILHELVPQEMQGRAFASVEAVIHLAYLVFMMVSSIAAEFIGTSYILLCVGFLFTFFGILGILKINPKSS